MSWAWKKFYNLRAMAQVWSLSQLWISGQLPSVGTVLLYFFDYKIKLVSFQNNP